MLESLKMLHLSIGVVIKIGVAGRIGTGVFEDALLDIGAVIMISVAGRISLGVFEDTSFEYWNRKVI
jgi:hypothetical protein